MLLNIFGKLFLLIKRPYKILILSSYKILVLTSKYLLVFKTYSRCLQDMSWRRLQHVFSVTIFFLLRRLEEPCKDILRLLKTSGRHPARCLGRWKIITLKTSLRSLEDISWRRLEDMPWRRFEDICWRPLQDVLQRSRRFTENICI